MLLLILLILTVLGALNTGLGSSGVNNFLTTMNIPWMNKKTFQRREKEAGKGVKKIADDACKIALQEEIKLSR